MLYLVHALSHDLRVAAEDGDYVLEFILSHIHKRYHFVFLSRQHSHADNRIKDSSVTVSDSTVGFVYHVNARLADYNVIHYAGLKSLSIFEITFAGISISPALRFSTSCGSFVADVIALATISFLRHH